MDNNLLRLGTRLIVAVIFVIAAVAKCSQWQDFVDVLGTYKFSDDKRLITIASVVVIAVCIGPDGMDRWIGVSKNH